MDSDRARASADVAGAERRPRALLDAGDARLAAACPAHALALLRGIHERVRGDLAVFILKLLTAEPHGLVTKARFPLLFGLFRLFRLFSLLPLVRVGRSLSPVERG